VGAGAKREEEHSIAAPRAFAKMLPVWQGKLRKVSKPEGGRFDLAL
jgi:hypothetical protein